MTFHIPNGGEIYRIHQHRRLCHKCKDWKFIKGGTMKRSKTGSPMANTFYCAECCGGGANDPVGA